MNILVIDVGTSSLRSVLFSEEGEILHSAQARYQVRTVSAEIVEQDPETWRTALRDTVRSVVQACRPRETIDAVALTSQRSSVIPVRKDGTALMPAVMWQDKRCAPVVEELRKEEMRIFRKTGARLNTVYAGPKMSFVRRAYPEIYREAEKLLTIADYLMFYIIGRFVTDASYGSRTLLMDLRKGNWDPELLQLFSVDPEKLCPIIRPGECAGLVQKTFSEATGIREGIPVMSAGGDQQCAALGMGLWKEGRMEATLGTGAFTGAVLKRTPGRLHPEITYNAHAVPGMILTENSILCCAALYDWIFRTMFSGTDDYEVINQAVSGSPAGSNGCICLPSFQGHGSPDWNRDARGGFFGLGLHTGRADMARAVLEALACETADAVERLAAYSGRPDELCVNGGMTRIPLMNQLLSDCSGLRVRVCPRDMDAAALGAFFAVLPALGLQYPDRRDRIYDRVMQDAEVYVPDPGRQQFYRELRTEIRQLYRTLCGGNNGKEKRNARKVEGSSL